VDIGQTFHRFLTDEGASAATEYGMIAAAIALLAIILLNQVGINFASAFHLLGTIATGTQT
jgi:Flp pilus assembly pilin Flp